MLMWLRGRTAALATGSGLVVIGIALLMASRSAGAGAYQGGQPTATAGHGGTPGATHTAAHSPTHVAGSTTTVAPSTHTPPPPTPTAHSARHPPRPQPRNNGHAGRLNGNTDRRRHDTATPSQSRRRGPRTATSSPTGTLTVHRNRYTYSTAGPRHAHLRRWDSHASGGVRDGPRPGEATETPTCGTTPTPTAAVNHAYETQTPGSPTETPTSGSTETPT